MARGALSRPEYFPVATYRSVWLSMPMNDGMVLIRERRGMIAKIGRELGIKPSAVSMWAKVPAERVVEVERITDIPRECLRPDLYRTSEAAE